MFTLTLLTCLNGAHAQEVPLPPPVLAEAQAPPERWALARPSRVPLAATLRFAGPRAADSVGSWEDAPTESELPKRRSRNLLLGALGAEVVAAALLGGAAATRSTYLDTDNPNVDLYRANRVLGHAGYASAVAGGALVLGSISLWEW